MGGILALNTLKATKTSFLTLKGMSGIPVTTDAKDAKDPLKLIPYVYLLFTCKGIIR